MLARREGTPLTVFEALAMGKPILATDADGLVDVLTHEHDAVIVPKRDAGALAAGLVRLIDSPEVRLPLTQVTPQLAERIECEIGRWNGAVRAA